MAVAFALIACGVGAATPKVSFTKSFPHSVPEYCSVDLDKSGAITYKESPTDELPLKAHLEESDVAVIFELASQLEYFKSPIESGLKVANTGKKTFRYEDESGNATEVVFNYSTIEAAQKLLDRFENIAASERAFSELDSKMRFDKLGVNDALAQIEELWLRKELVAPQQFVPLFEKIVSRASFMHLVRDRAARLKDTFQSSATAAGAPAQKEK